MPPLNRAFAESFVGQVLDRKYRLKRVLGAGAFGFVLEAEHVVSGEAVASVAVKLVPLQTEGLQDQLRELKEAVRLGHPKLVRCFSVGDDELEVAGQKVPFLFLVMELAHGTLARRLRHGLLGAEESRQLGLDIAKALEYLRNEKRVHRDLKPSNILRFEDGWKLADLGILKQLDAGVTTLAGASGTLFYMPPESHSDVISPSWDMWSLGVTLMEAVTNQLPYPPTNRGEWLHSIRKEDPQIPFGIPEPLNTVIRGCLARDRANRLTPSQVVSILQDRGEHGQLRPEAETLVVAPAGGHFASVEEAVRLAPAWSRILVKPGRYEGTVTLRKPMELLGSGAAADIVLEGGTGPALVVMTSEALVRGIALKTSGEIVAAVRAVVEVRSGHSTLDLCEVSSATTDCLYVLGKAAQPVIRRTRFIAGRRHGLVFDSDAEGLVENCVVAGSQIAAILISDGANPLIRRSSVQSPGLRGIYVSQDGRGIVEDCQLLGGTGPAVELAKGAETVFRKTRISAGTAAAVLARSGAKAVFIDCDGGGSEDIKWDLAAGHQVKRL